MSVAVMGGVATEFGLKTAQTVQRKHNQDVAEKLLNISGIGTQGGQPVHMDDPRPAYAHQQFPKMLYKPDPGEKGEKIVLTQTEMAVAIQDGWREEPYPRVQIAVLDPASEKKALLDTNNQLQSQLIKMQEQMNQMAEQMAAAAKKAK